MANKPNKLSDTAREPLTVAAMRGAISSGLRSCRLQQRDKWFAPCSAPDWRRRRRCGSKTRITPGAPARTVRLGERENGTARLEQAVEAFRNALKEFTRERMPLELGEDAEQPRQRACDARSTRERHRAAGTGG